MRSVTPANLIVIKPNHVYHNTSTKFLNMYFWNARSINNKITCLHNFLSANRCDIMTIAETWLYKLEDDGDRNQVVINNILPDNYCMLHIPRPDGRGGGGIGLIYNKNIDMEVKDMSQQLQYKQFESMSVLLKFKNSSVCLSTVYRPQPTKKNNLKVKMFWKDWVKFLTAHIEQNNHFVITGDLNFHLDVPNDPYAVKFNSLISEFGLQQMITEPTHTKGHTLDVLITSSDNTLVTSHAVLDLGFTNDSGVSVNDHFAINWKLKAERKQFKAKTKRIRKWKNIDIDSFKQDIQSCINNELMEDEANSCNLVEWYNKTFLTLVEKHAPEKTVSITRKPNPWYSNVLRDQKRECRKLERKWMKTKLVVDHQIYRKQCNLFNNQVRLAQMNYNKKLVSSCGRDQKKIFSLSNRLLGRLKVSTFPKTDSDTHCANNFIKFFSNKVIKIHADLTEDRNQLLLQHPDISHMTRHPTPHHLHLFEETDDNEIKKIVGSMANKQSELDPLPMWLLKSILEIIAPRITQIVNTSLSTATMPSSLKTAVIRPILKDSTLDSNDYNNFRPVSNLPILSKIIEKVVYNRLTNHINENGLYGRNQSAYRKYHSTETALLKVQNDILMSLDKGKFVALVMIDVSAAFDTVEHQSLLNRFDQEFGIRGKALQWLHSYLSNRKQKVAINSSHSELSDILYGFPQGATLAGLCFNCYSKPLGNIAQNFRPVDQHSYADDGQTYISFTCKNKEQAMILLQNCLEDIRKWMVFNHLKINNDKNKVIFFSPKKQISTDLAINIKFGSATIKPSLVVKNLGILMDNLLTMEKQINKTTKSAYFHIRNISKVRKFLDIETTKTLVHTLVISRIDYCNSLFINLPQRLLKKVQRAQNSAARLIAKTSKRAHITPVLKELHWLPVTARVTFKVLLQTYKCVMDFLQFTFLKC